MHQQSSLQRELAIEQAHVDQVYSRLTEATKSANRVATEGHSKYQSDRANFVREEDGTGLFERDVFAFQAAKRLATLDAEHEGLVFGRLDRDSGEVQYIGRIGVRDAEYEPLVIDWRARAAEPFYRATPTDPMAIVRRRVLRCRGEQVIGIEDDLLDAQSNDGDLVVIGEGALLAALSRARGHQMRDIVATIQSEQDEAIRAPYQGVSIIGGGPGTGKTVVALHRAAYLLYSHRRRFENGGVLVVGPSRVFMNYIERVLPSLGEDSVTLRSIGTVASDVISTRGDRVDAAAAGVVKGSTRMLTLLRRLVNEPLTGDALLCRVNVKGEVLILDANRLSKIRADVLRHNKINPARDSARKAVLDALWGRFNELLDTDLEREAFDELATDQAGFTMFMHAWWPPLTATGVLSRLSDTALVDRLAEDLFTPEEQAHLAASYAGHDAFSVADTALLDELVHLIGTEPAEAEIDPLMFLGDGAGIDEVVTTSDRWRGPSEEDPDEDRHQTYAHILVDEAQDITPMQWRMLRRRGAQASWTIVGDTAQSSWPDTEEYEHALAELVGRAPVRRFRMSTNYRSPAEVFDLAAKVVQRDYPQADLPVAVRETGVQPELLVSPREELSANLLLAVARLSQEVEGTIGIIAPAGLVAELQALVLDVPAAPRLPVVTALEAKGLEYDAVIVVSPDEIVAENSGGVRVLYVALTRPTMRLLTIDLDQAGHWRAGLE